MPRTLAWTDGSMWTVDEPTFRRVTDQLGAVRAVVWGFDPIYDRWVSLAAQGDRVPVDEVAPTEDDRAVLTAALERAVEEARAAGPRGAGLEGEPAQFAAYLQHLVALHELFVTDVTHTMPRKRKR